MKTLKCPVCGKILDLVNDHSLMVHMGNFHYENRSAFYYVCRKCQIATEYGESGKGWFKLIGYDVVPEPSTSTMSLLGIVCILLKRRRG